MSIETLDFHAPTAQVTPAAAAVRLDLYAAIHKALRLVMADTLVQAGRLDPADEAQRREGLAQIRQLCAMCRSHVEKENGYVHPLLEARRPGASARIASEHEEHLVAIEAIEADAAVFEAVPTAANAHRLYRHLASFVAENFVHMEVEESRHNALLWASCSDAELMQVHERILASIAPQEMAQVLHWMLPALSHGERVGMLSGMRESAPAPAFEGALQIARLRLPRAEWDRLAATLGVA